LRTTTAPVSRAGRFEKSIRLQRLIIRGRKDKPLGPAKGRDRFAAIDRLAGKFATAAVDFIRACAGGET
jgi:hypothetical protein